MNAFSADLPDLPGPDDVRTACEVAGRLEPIPSYARHYAYRALILAFPDLPHASAAELVGSDFPKAFAHANGQCEGLAWWKESILDEVLHAVANAPGQGRIR